MRDGDLARPLIPRLHRPHILAAEGDTHRAFFDGSYQEYEVGKRKRLGEEGAKPKKIWYKPISR